MAKIFYNYTNEDFTHSWDSKPYTIKAGEKEPFPDYLADHLAKHFINREIRRKNKATTNDPAKRAEIESKVLLPLTEDSEDALEEEIAMLKAKVKKPKKTKKVSSKPEEDFEGLTE